VTRTRAPLRTLIVSGENLKSRMEIDDGVPAEAPPDGADAVAPLLLPPQPAATAAVAKLTITRNMGRFMVNSRFGRRTFHKRC
jgi:hypothetical protein